MTQPYVIAHPGVVEGESEVGQKEGELLVDLRVLAVDCSLQVPRTPCPNPVWCGGMLDINYLD